LSNCSAGRKSYNEHALNSIVAVSPRVRPNSQLVKRNRSRLVVASILFLAYPFAFGTQADETTITITGQNPGATSLIKQLVLLASDTSVIRSVAFTITPKPGSVTRPLSGTFATSYLIERGYLDPGTGQIFLPVYGLYAGYANAATLTY